MIWIWIILCLCVPFVYSFYGSYRKHSRSKKYLKELKIPYIPGSMFTFLWSAIKSQLSSKELNLHELEMEKYKKYGRIYSSCESGDPEITIGDPDLLRKILVKDFPVFTGRRNFESGDIVGDNFLSVINGEKWKRIRTIITPAFSTGKIKRMTDIIISSAKILVDNFMSEAGKPIDGKKFFDTFTMDVIARSAFGTKIYSYQDPNNRFVQEGSKFFVGSFTLKTMFFLAFPKLALSLGIGFYDSEMINFFRKATLQIIEDRKETGTVKNDFLQLLIEAGKGYEKEEDATLENAKEDAEDEILEFGHEEENAKIFKPTKKYKSLSNNELLAQCLIFFLAGFGTIATALTCAFYELVVNPDIQEKLRKEIDAEISDDNSQLTYEGVQKMRYLDYFLSEILRKYPSAVRTERLADADYELESTGITIKKGTIVGVPIYAIHHDPEFYPEPHLFRPERFAPEAKSTRHPYSYLTFGAGPRNCIGMRFALMEIKLCIAYVLSRLIIKKCPQTQVPLKLSSSPLVGLLKPYTIFTVEKRKNVVLEDDL